MSDWDRTPGDTDDFTPWDPDEAADASAGDAGVVVDNGADASEPAVDPAVVATGPEAAEAVAAAEREPGEAPAAFIDSSAIVALVDQDDDSHLDAVAAYRELVAGGYRLFTTNYVIAETYDLLRTGVGHAVARQWLKDSTLAVYHADEQDERRARRTVLRARGAKGMTFTDAVSLVVMERFGVADAFAVDPNFLSGGE
jgi:uncharacterized protein